MSLPRIGVIGAGMMGAGLAGRLLDAGHPVCVLVHRNRAPVEPLLKRGAAESADAPALVATCDVILTCLPNADTVDELYRQIGPALRTGQVWVDVTTSRPEVTKRIAAELEGRGAVFADAPVVGGPTQAVEGTLASLVGCPPGAFDRVAAITGTYSRRTRRFGDTGSGHAAKLLNNLVTQSTMVLLADAFRSADALGLDKQALYDVMMVGAGRSGTLEKAVGPSLQGDYRGARFTIANAFKDLGYAQDLLAGLDPERGARAEILAQRLGQLVAAGHGDRFVSEMLDPDLPCVGSATPSSE